jgi:hypothetical protein
MKKAGGCLVLAALPFVLLAVFMALSPLEPDDTLTESLTPGLFFASVLFVPGMVLYVVGKRAQKEQEFLQAVTGMMRSHDAFTAAELALRIGRSELETEQLIHRIDERTPDLDLVFHRASRRYIHRTRLEAGAYVVERCGRCGAPTGHQVVLPGEWPTCAYCQAPLSSTSAS